MKNIYVIDSTEPKFLTNILSHFGCWENEANAALKYDNEMTNWLLVEVLMSDKTAKTVALGWHDDARMAADYELVKTYIGLDKPFDVKTAYTNEFLDKSIKMTK